MECGEAWACRWVRHSKKGEREGGRGDVNLIIFFC